MSPHEQNQAWHCSENQQRQKGHVGEGTMILLLSDNFQDNITCFLRACELLGVKKADLFDTNDLSNKKNMSQVCCFAGYF